MPTTSYLCHVAVRRISALLGCLIIAASAKADIELYALRKSHVFEQTGDATVDPSYFRFDAQVRTVNPGDLTSVNVTGGTDGPVSLALNGNTWTYTSPGFASAADLDAAYPDNEVYGINVDGSGGPETLSVEMPTLNPSAVPMLAGSTFSGLNAWDPASGDFMMTFNSHTEFPNILYVLTYITFYDETLNDGVPLFWSLPSSATSLQLDSSLFVSGHDYSGRLTFFHQYSDSEEEFFGAIKNFSTTFSFTTATTGGGTPGVPDSGSTLGLFAAALGLFACQRRVRACVN